MKTVAAIVAWALFGLIAGAIARLLVPGRQPIGIAATMILGVTGSFVGGFIAWIFTGGAPLQASNWIMSILGAIVLLAIYVAFAKRRA